MPSSRTPARHLPLPRAALAGAAGPVSALVLVLALLAPATAAAKARHGRSATPIIVVRACTVKRGKNAPKPSPRCVPAAGTRHSASARHVPAPRPPRLEATPLTGETSAAGTPGATAPASAPPLAAPPATPPPASGSGAPSLPAPAPAEAGAAAANSDPIDPRFLTALPFGKMSFWVQPWRAYLDTWPVSRMTEALGINFNVAPAIAEPTAQLLQDNGFKLARVDISWNGLSYSDPTKLRADLEPSVLARFTALRNHGLRPLIVLDANSGDPAPSKLLTLETTAPAAAGARTVQLGASSAAAVVPGKTGFNNLAFGGSPDLLIESVDASGLATLARPLQNALPAGTHGGTTLLYAPFTPPTLPDGQPNPAFQETLAGWLTYVSTVSKFASSIFGPGGFDLEVWNELTFGSQFLNSENYYSAEAENPQELSSEGAPPEQPKRITVTHSIIRAILEATVSYVRSPQNGLTSEVGITDGFASETPFPSGASAPIGLTALSKHPYVGERRFPEAYDPSALRPVNALGVQDTVFPARLPFQPLFTPTYQSLLPEYTLTGTSTETLIRDLAPITTEVYGFPHGREVGPPGGKPVQKWITEYNLSVPRGVNTLLPAADKAHFHAKALLRSLVAMVSKGISREYFFAAASGSLSLIDEGFFKALEAHPGSYPGDRAGGEIIDGFHNLLSQFQGPGPSGTPQQLKLLSITQQGDHAQFQGDGTAAHPTLWDREVLAVFPFQSSPTRFVIPVYVMTRNLLTLYNPTASPTDITRYDLPNETFHITLSNLPQTKTPPTVTAYDPLKNQHTPARLLTREGNTATFEIAATDYPRLLELEYPSS
jgi:hypothetical protein